jgi:hypothetical protein
VDEISADHLETGGKSPTIPVPDMQNFDRLRMLLATQKIKGQNLSCILLDTAYMCPEFSRFLDEDVSS